MKNNTVFKIVIESIQWVLIGALIGLCCWLFMKFRAYVNDNNDQRKYSIIYNDRKVDELLQENKRLQDSIKVLNNDTVEFDLRTK